MPTERINAWDLYGDAMSPEARRYFDEIVFLGPTAEREINFTRALGIPESEDSLHLDSEDDDWWAMRTALVQFTDALLLSDRVEAWVPPVLSATNDCNNAPEIDQQNWSRMVAACPVLF